jgi:hypothetical protein
LAKLFNLLQSPSLLLTKKKTFGGKSTSASITSKKLFLIKLGRVVLYGRLSELSFQFDQV